MDCGFTIGTFFSFVPRDPRIEAEWREGFRLPDVMPVNVLGFQTHRDHFAVALERETIQARLLGVANSPMRWFASGTRSRIIVTGRWRPRDLACEPMRIGTIKSSNAYTVRSMCAGAIFPNAQWTIRVVSYSTM
jgi:hypothetical protein